MRNLIIGLVTFLTMTTSAFAASVDVSKLPDPATLTCAGDQPSYQVGVKSIEEQGLTIIANETFDVEGNFATVIDVGSVKTDEAHYMVILFAADGCFLEGPYFFTKQQVQDALKIVVNV